MRPDAVFDKSKPISGGLPWCFPQFGPGAMQQHGFARNLDWEVASTSADLQPDERDPEVEFVLTESDYTLKMWPHKFKAVRWGERGGGGRAIERARMAHGRLVGLAGLAFHVGP